MKRRALLALWPALAAWHAAAAPSVVYRCGAEGRTFTQTPCAGGQVVPIAPGPDERAKQEARAVAEREARLAARLVDERRQREAEARRALEAAYRSPRRVTEPAPTAAAAPDARPSRRARVPKAAAASGR